jgi:hypothetical protein
MRPSGFLPDLVLPSEDADTRPGDLSILMRNVEALAPHARSSPRIVNRSTVGHGYQWIYFILSLQGNMHKGLQLQEGYTDQTLHE